MVRVGKTLFFEKALWHGGGAMSHWATGCQGSHGAGCAAHDSMLAMRPWNTRPCCMPDCRVACAWPCAWLQL